MLIRVKYKDKEGDDDDGCLCQREKKCDLNDWAECEGKHCTSRYWHKECVGLEALSDEEFEKVKFICPLCRLSQKKFKKTFTLIDEQQEKLKEMVKEIKDLKLQDETEELKKQLNDMRKMKEQQKDWYKKEEIERNNFYAKVTKQLNQFKQEIKNEISSEGEQKSHYKEALLRNMTRLETNQQEVVSKLETNHNEVVSKVAKEVVAQSRISDYDRSLREKNVIIFDCQESSDDAKFIDGLFGYLDMKKENLKLYRLGERKEGKTRPLKVTFEELMQKRHFLSRLYKLSEAPELYKSINVQHDLSSKERDNLKSLLDKAKELNRIEDPKDFRYRVRGPPFAFEIRKIRNRRKMEPTDETNKESKTETISEGNELLKEGNEPLQEGNKESKNEQ